MSTSQRHFERRTTALKNAVLLLLLPCSLMTAPMLVSALPLEVEFAAEEDCEASEYVAEHESCRVRRNRRTGVQIPTPNAARDSHGVTCCGMAGHRPFVSVRHRLMHEQRAPLRC